MASMTKRIEAYDLLLSTREAVEQISEPDPRNPERGRHVAGR